MSKRNYYEVLGLTSTCTAQEIKRSYHQLALVWHPDKHSNKIDAQAEFNFINEAYTILNDAKKRKIYDTYGQKGLDMDQECEDFANSNNKNCFYQKGFQGTDKSAFDILRDIFEENEDDCFFKDYDMCGMSNTFKSTLESFVNENIVSSEGEGEGDNFIANYKPTFMNSNFYSEFDQLFTAGGYTTNLLSSFSNKGKKNETRNQKRDNSGFISEKNECNSGKKTTVKAKDLFLDTKDAPKSQKKTKKHFLINDEDDDDEERLYKQIKGFETSVKLNWSEVIYGSDSELDKINNHNLLKV